MQIVMIPEAGSAPTLVRVEGGTLTRNGAAFDLANLPDQGPVHAVEGTAFVAYGKDGALAATQIGDAHDLRIIPVPEDQKLKEDPAPDTASPAPDGQDQAGERQAMSCARWQLILALGPEAWQSVQDFCAGPLGTWAMQQSVAGFDTIGRLSELTDLLSYAADLDAVAMDGLFREAMALKL